MRRGKAAQHHSHPQRSAQKGKPTHTPNSWDSTILIPTEGKLVPYTAPNGGALITI